MLYNYYLEDCDEEEWDAARKSIIRHLRGTSEFAVFKRWTIKENEVFNKEFGNLIA